MRPATLQEEKKLWKKGYGKVCCLDEAGVGPLAGPVVAGAVILNWRTFLHKRSVLPNIRDSKQLSAKQRDEFYKIITKDPAIKWGIGIVSEKIIDKINIFQATKLAMKKAVENAENASPAEKRSPKYWKIDYLILDGRIKIDSSIPQKSIVRGDEKVFSCAAASIIAKVTRDRIMMRYHKKYPQYGFDIHKGYGTKVHYQMIKKHGPCQIHRKSYNLNI